MKEEKKVLSIHTNLAIIEKLKAIATKEKRSQAKTLEVLIEEKHEKLFSK